LYHNLQSLYDQDQDQESEYYKFCIALHIMFNYISAMQTCKPMMAIKFICILHFIVFFFNEFQLFSLYIWWKEDGKVKTTPTDNFNVNNLYGTCVQPVLF
jgi:hypothetical protein